MERFLEESESQAHSSDLPVSTEQGKNRRWIVLWGILYILVIAIVGYGGYLFRIEWDKKQQANYQESSDIGEALASKYASSRDANPGTIKIYAWSDNDGDGKQGQYEGGLSRVVVQIKRVGENYTNYSGETDAQGIVLVDGLSDDEYDVGISYYGQPNLGYQDDFYFVPLFEVTSSNIKAKGLLPIDWLRVNGVKTGANVEIGISSYKPTQIVVAQYKSLYLLDPKSGKMIGTSNYKVENTLPPKYVVRGDKLFYVRGGALYSQSVLDTTYVNKSLIYDNLRITNEEFFELSPDGKSIIYNYDGVGYWRTPDDKCGGRQLFDGNTGLQIVTASSPYRYILAQFSDNDHVIFRSFSGGREGLYLASCEGKSMSVRRLPLSGGNGGVLGSVVYTKPDTLIIKSNILHEKSCNGSDCSESRDQAMYIYNIGSDSLTRLGDSKYDNMSIEDNFGKYLLLADYNSNKMGVLDLENMKLTSWGQGELTSQDAGFFMSANYYLYLGDNRMMFLGKAKCSSGKECYTLKSFEVGGDKITNLKTVGEIEENMNSSYIGRLVGEVHK